MAMINGRRVCRADGMWVDYEDFIAKTSERVLALLADGPKTRRYLGGSIGGDARFIDVSLRRLASSGLVAGDPGRVLNCRRGRTWTRLG